MQAMSEHVFELEMRGYNRDEVNTYIREMEEEFDQKLNRAEAKNREAEKRTEELTRRLEKKERQKEQLENEIETKYRTYIDNYDKIAALVYESQLKAEKTLKEAEEQKAEILRSAEKEAGERLAEAKAEEERIREESERILSEAKERERRILTEADAEAKRRVDAVSDTVEAGLADGRTRYSDMRVQIEGLLSLLDEAQKRFEDGCGHARDTFENMPESIDAFADDGSDFDEDEPLQDDDFDSFDPETL